MSNSNVTAKKSKCKAGGRWIATKNHNFMYFLTALAIPGLFIVNTSFNAYTGFVLGGVMLCLGFIFLDLNMGYYWQEICKGVKGVRRFLCSVGFTLTFACTIISLITCVSMFDAKKSLDYSLVNDLTDEYKALIEQQKLVGSEANPDNFVLLGREAMQKRKEVTQAKNKARTSIGYAPEHAVFYKYGWNMEKVRLFMSFCIVITCLISVAVYRIDDTTDTLESNEEKPRIRVTNQGNGVVAV